MSDLNFHPSFREIIRWADSIGYTCKISLRKKKNPNKAQKVSPSIEKVGNYTVYHWRRKQSLDSFIQECGLELNGITWDKFENKIRTEFIQNNFDSFDSITLYTDTLGHGIWPGITLAFMDAATTDYSKGLYKFFKTREEYNAWKKKQK